MADNRIFDEDRTEADNEPRWYVIHTYAGYENKVAATIMKTVENHGLQHMIQDVSVPMETVIECVDGVDREVQKKVFPGYVLVHMLMNDEAWHIVRNVRGVTSFVGPGSQPVALTQDEVDRLGIGITEVVSSFELGDRVQIADGPFEGFVGVIESISDDKKKLKVKISMFGRDTSTEIDVSDVEMVEE